MPTIDSLMPTTSEVADLLSACKGRRIRMTYENQLPPRRKTASVIAAAADTKRIHPLDVVRGTISDVWITQEGHAVIRLPSRNRLKKLPKNEGCHAGMRKGQRLWRTYRVKGIDLRSLRVAHGAGRVMSRACPNTIIRQAI